ncbi:hypothetical protein HYH02_004650 [Chlamydomonas schloesseri]|uniref:Uncharacterized protein n=1 Tax=Chlamydomonas schloesseri TaxID=2026947 RepID=A0A836B8S8_9CHLO|nr:hypothetical protein HYH02_004650 [Chlamydomonas schloesseri]|eukprot:KAG2450815.1 hypothetical protein HYH02_004650 [Chlamydomonas schloesseri]
MRTALPNRQGAACLLHARPWLRPRICSQSRCRTLIVSQSGAVPSHTSLQFVLDQLRRAQGIGQLDPNAEAVVSGRGKHLGIAVTWSLRWTAGGAFREEIRGPQLTFAWGHDGAPDSSCWEVDSSGLARYMECDDHEAVLLTAYLRTGCWLQPHLADRFDMELLPPPLIKLAAQPAAAAAAAAPAAGAAVASSSGSSSSSSGSSSSSSSGVRKAPGAQPQPQPPSPEEVVALGIRVRGRRLRVRVLVRRRDWRLLGFDHRMCADTETWELGEWRQWDAGVLYPSSAVHKASNGGQHAYLTGAGALERLCPGAAGSSSCSGSSGAVAGSSSSNGSSIADEAGLGAGPSERTHGSAPAPMNVSVSPEGVWGGGNGNGSSSGTGSSSSGGTGSAAAPVPAQAAVAAPEAVAGGGGGGGSATGDCLPLPTFFGMPLLPPIPTDTTYDLGTPGAGSSSSGSGSSSSSGGAGQQLAFSRVPLWRAASGHYLVRPTINGQEGGGYFVLDSGASGFVVTPQAAARLGGQAFGETHAASISGKVAARFIRLGSWALGGLSIAKPVLMVMELEGLVKGAPGEVVGIVGHDLFRRAVLELPAVAPGAAPAGSSSSSSSSSSRAPGAGAGGRSSSSNGNGTTGHGAGSAASSYDEGEELAAAMSSGDVSVSGSSRSCSGSSSVLGRGSGSDSGSEEEQLQRSEPGVQVAAAAAAATAVGSSSSSRPGGAGAAAAPAFGPPPRPPQSTPAFDPGASASSLEDRSGSGIGASSSSSSSSAAATARRSRGRSVTARAVRRAAQTVPYSLHEMGLHHPLEYGNERGWVWHPLVMIANLPHVHLTFADPFDPVAGPVRSALLMLDSGACGADLMLHARAQKELGLLQPPAGAAGAGGAVAGRGGSGSGGGQQQGHYLRGVGQDPKDFVQLQVLDLPWLEMGGVRFEKVRCMCAAVGGLDISIYSHGILCGDLLARLEWAVDYTHKRIGFRRGALGAAGPLAAAAAAAAASSAAGGGAGAGLEAEAEAEAAMGAAAGLAAAAAGASPDRGLP